MLTPVILLALGLAAIQVVLSRYPDSETRRRWTVDTLKQWDIILEIYANAEPRERLPGRAAGHWVPDLRGFYPEFLNDPALVYSSRLTDSTDEALLDAVLREKPVDLGALEQCMARHFVYTGYALPDAEDMRRLAQVLEASNGNDLSGDIETGEVTLYRLREGVERFLIPEQFGPDAPVRVPSRVPVLIENTFARDIDGYDKGAHILYMDGRVEYVTIDEQPAFFAALTELLELRDSPER
jgi:hypothetical protein